MEAERQRETWRSSPDSSTQGQGLTDLSHLSSNKPRSAPPPSADLQDDLEDLAPAVPCQPGLLPQEAREAPGCAPAAASRVVMKTQLFLLKPACWVQPKHQHCPKPCPISKQAYLHTKTAIRTHSSFHHFTHDHITADCVSKWAKLFHALVLGNQLVLQKAYPRFMMETNIKTKYLFIYFR